MSKAESILDRNYWTTDKNFNENIKPSILLAMKEIAELNFEAGANVGVMEDIEKEKKLFIIELFKD